MDEQSINYNFKKSYKAKQLRISVYYDGRVVVTIPFWVGQTIVEKFINNKKQWILDKLKFFKANQNNIIPVLNKKDYLQNKKKALLIVKDRIEFYNKIYNFSFNKIYIRNQKTRWGSCSSNKNISINYKVLFLSNELLDYIIVHELCHLKEMNHSKNFWKLVESVIPNYLELKKQLRKIKL